MAKVAHALAAAGEVRQLLTDAHLALTVTQKEVGLGTRMFGAGVKPASAKMVDEGSNDRQGADAPAFAQAGRSEEHTSELQSLMRISYAVFCLKKKRINQYTERES